MCFQFKQLPLQRFIQQKNQEEIKSITAQIEIKRKDLKELEIIKAEEDLIQEKNVEIKSLEKKLKKSCNSKKPLHEVF